MRDWTKIDKISENSADLPEVEKKKIQQKKNIVLATRLSTKKQKNSSNSW
jgi:hypothetical protein